MCFPILILCLIGIGILEINYPNALSLSGLNDNYTGRGWAGLLLLVFELITAATWGRVTGILLTVLGISLLALWGVNLVRDKFKPSTEDVASSLKEDNEPLSIKALALKSALLSYKQYRNRKARNND